MVCAVSDNNNRQYPSGIVRRDDAAVAAGLIETALDAFVVGWQAAREYERRVGGAWVEWANRLEALALAHPVHCQCWDGARNATEPHHGLCAEWREIASAIRTKPTLSPGPGREAACARDSDG